VLCCDGLYNTLLKNKVLSFFCPTYHPFSTFLFKSALQRFVFIRTLFDGMLFISLWDRVYDKETVPDVCMCAHTHTRHTSFPGKTLGSCLPSTSTNCNQHFFTIATSLNNVLDQVSFLLPFTISTSITSRTYLHENCWS
jgi:hypothetical protein